MRREQGGDEGVDFGVGYADRGWVEDEVDAGGVAGHCWQCVRQEFHNFKGRVDGEFVVEGLESD